MAFGKTPSYTPIDCGFHDLLEHYAVLEQTVNITYGSASPANSATITDDIQTVNAVIVDVFARDGADWATVRTTGRDDLVRVRLDHIVSINGTARPSNENACNAS